MQCGEMVQGARRVDDPRGCRRKQALAQTVGQHERGDMIECECALEAIWRDFAPREHRSGIVDQDVHARLRRGDVCRDPLDLGKPKQVGIVDAVPCQAESGRATA